MLPFSLPTTSDMLITFGAGIGGRDRERARKYVPTVPTEVLEGLRVGGVSVGGWGSGGDEKRRSEWVREWRRRGLRDGGREIYDFMEMRR